VSDPTAPNTVWRDLRMLFPALLGWVSCALGIWLRPGVWSVAASLGLAIVLGILAARSRRAGLNQLITPVLVVAVMMGAVFLGSLARDQPELMAVANGQVTADIRLAQTYLPGATTVRADIVAVQGLPLAAGAAPVRVTGDLGNLRRALGASTTVSGYLQRSNPWEQQSWFLIVHQEPEEWHDAGWFLEATDALRADFLDRSLMNEGDAGRLLPGLAIGDTSAVDPSLVDAMRQTSLSHLVAVSGANCAIVVAIVVALVALFGGGLWLRMIAGVVALIGFVVLVTPEPSIIRASIMASIVLAFLASSRPVRGIPVLGVTVLALLATNPWLATDFAFALSVAATGGILLLTGPLVGVLSPYLPRAVALVVALPFAAQIACQPLLILLNPIIPLWAVMANGLAAPAAPLATILGMLACVVGPLAPSLAEGILWLAWWPAGYIAAIGRVLAATPMSTVPWPPGWWGALSIGVIGYAGVAWYVMRQRRHRLVRRSLAMASLGMLGVVGATFFVPQQVIRSSVPDPWTLAQCDVGQGDALIIRSESRVAVIDTGRDSPLFAECLSLLGISKIDLLIITHFDLDHYGAWRVIAENTASVWISSVEDDREDDVIAGLDSFGIPVHRVSAGASATVGGYHLEVVWPVNSALAEPGNDSSVVISLTPLEHCEACLSALFLGDLGEQPQRMLSARHDFGTPDVVKVSHHGSGDQFDGLYRDLGAPVALIGVGAENSYGHPTPKVLQLVAETAVVVRSDLHGTSTLHRNSDGEIVLWSER